MDVMDMLKISMPNGVDLLKGIKVMPNEVDMVVKVVDGAKADAVDGAGMAEEGGATVARRRRTGDQELFARNSPLLPHRALAGPVLEQQ
jgi:hypothetical protein